MPTEGEVEELKNNCTWTWTTQKGVKGYKVTSKSNGNSIFFPVAGFRDDDRLGDAGSCGFYRSSSLSDYGSDLARYLYFSSGSVFPSGYYRYYGQPVRPVYPSPLCNQCGKKDCQTNNKHEKCPTCGEYDLNCRFNCHHPEYVDLGLSVKWATFNVGATRPEEYGDYFAWGETKPKKTYNWSTYKWCKGTVDSLTKYCTNSPCGKVDNNTTLAPEDDAAYVNWGGAWRMPTKDELIELKNNCTWTWTTQKGVEGYKVVGQNGNSIFLPAAGYRYDDSLDDAKSNCDYWSSSLYTSFSGLACELRFGSCDVDWDYYGGRHDGRSVRAVCH